MQPGERASEPAAEPGAIRTGTQRRRARRNGRLSATDIEPYRFLVGHLIDAATLDRAVRIARRWHTMPHNVLIALGKINETTYASALARHLDVPLAPTRTPPSADGDTSTFEATAWRPDETAYALARERSAGRKVQLALRGAGTAPAAEKAVFHATHHLKRRHPSLSAGHPTKLWQKITASQAIGMTFGGVLLAPAETIALLLGLITIPFVMVTALRLLALNELLTPRPKFSGSQQRQARVADAALPVYTLLVPLYDEAEVVSELIGALSRLDYPPDKLDIILLLEASDAATRASVESQSLPAHMRRLIVPSGKPRTKPRALNYGLVYARGDFVVVYDAEDVPEPGQLRRAFAVLRERAGEIGCVQARLNIYNPHASWLSRQFTIEYSTLFDAMLPTLERYDLPVPLGGTSNHFPRYVLEAVGGWDPYNVTEDADLGIRLARRGFKVAIIDSTTWEEAPVHHGVWLRQRTRWLKGWMQTILVHTRQPMRLMSDLGDARLLGIMSLMGGLVLSALVHPWFYVLVAYEAWRGGLMGFPDTLVAQSLWGLAALNLLIGYATAILLGIVAVARRGHLALLLHVPLIPFYWLAISLAAYRALYQLARDPYLWEKTPHTRESRNGQHTG
jgi:glycosyltransferase involved in cell wall biosynthesis